MLHFKLNCKRIGLYIFIFFILFICFSFFIYKKCNINKFNKNYSCIFNDINSSNLLDVINFIKSRHDVYVMINVLKLSKYYIDNCSLADAEYWLKYGIRCIDDDDDLKAIFSIRLVRVLYEENKFSESLSIIEQFVHIDYWKYVFLNIKGDILLSMGDKRNAKKIWLDILNSNNNLIFSQLIRIKVNSIF